eukprot:TRINITY_DN3885_c0_g2_i1.p1 TRINITY_DN3885_c0_g2~~TRINITY_DN3885_c0_g2_i1.p1  ORF type:complete len:592 (+),score=134.98 TRINITY_DN3885_c0_g2_i1:109-1776(+)
MGNGQGKHPHAGLEEKFNPGEISQLEQLFEYLSKGTDYIPVNQFQKAYFPKNNELSALLHHAFDRDHDGQVNEVDFLSSYVLCRSDIRTRQDLVFTMFDAKFSGMADAELMKKLLGEEEEESSAGNYSTCQGRWDYPAQSAKELSFTAGDYMTVLQEVDETWLWVLNAAGVKGYVPRTYVQVLPAVVKELPGINGLAQVKNADGLVTPEQYYKFVGEAPRVHKVVNRLIRFDTRPPSSMKIAGPTDFVHVRHLGFNPKTGTFDSENLPTEWKRMFKNAGITKSDVQDPETAAMLVDIIHDEQEKLKLGVSQGVTHAAPLAPQPSAPPPLPARPSATPEVHVVKAPATKNDAPPPVPTRPRSLSKPSVSSPNLTMTHTRSRSASRPLPRIPGKTNYNPTAVSNKPLPVPPRLNGRRNTAPSHSRQMSSPANLRVSSPLPPPPPPVADSPTPVPANPTAIAPVATGSGPPPPPPPPPAKSPRARLPAASPHTAPPPPPANGLKMTSPRRASSDAPMDFLAEIRMKKVSYSCFSRRCYSHSPSPLRCDSLLPPRPSRQ